MPAIDCEHEKQISSTVVTAPRTAETVHSQPKKCYRGLMTLFGDFRVRGRSSVICLWLLLSWYGMIFGGSCQQIWYK